jgi:hypothetical protein
MNDSELMDVSDAAQRDAGPVVHDSEPVVPMPVAPQPKVRVWPPRPDCAPATAPELSIDQSLTETLKDHSMVSQMESDDEYVPMVPFTFEDTTVPVCPQCQLKLIDPKGLGLCPQCGYCRSLEIEREEASAAVRQPTGPDATRIRGTKLGWLWLLVASATALITMVIAG